MKILRPEPFADPFAYYRLFRDAWSLEEAFIVVESDVSASTDILEKFETCSEPWCFNSYPIPANAHSYEPVHPGCVDCGRTADDHPSDSHVSGFMDHSFRPVDLTCRYCGDSEHAPRVAIEIADIGGYALGCSRFRPFELPAIFDHELLKDAVHWANLDVHITTALRLSGVPSAHRHMPNVKHGDHNG